MTTRGKLARGEHQPQFEGHVQRWVKQLEPLSEGSKVKVLKWVPTGDRSERPAESRVPHLKPVRDSALKVVFRPKQALSAQPGQQPPAAPGSVAREHVLSEPSQSTAEAAMLVQQRAGTAAPPEPVQMNGRSPHVPEVAQSGQHEQQAASGAQEQNARDAVTEQAAPEGPAGESDRAVAQQAADECLAALHADTGGQPRSIASTPLAAQENVHAGVHVSPDGSKALPADRQQHDAMHTSMPATTHAPESKSASEAAEGREDHLLAGDSALAKQDSSQEDIEMPQTEREQEHDPDHVSAKKRKVED